MLKARLAIKRVGEGVGGGLEDGTEERRRTEKVEARGGFG